MSNTVKPKPKEKTITQNGVMVKGTARLSLWGGGEGTIEMKEAFLPLEHATEENILRCVNDNGFGCQRIISAEIEVYTHYDNGSEDFDRGFTADKPEQTKLFLGWIALREQGIEI